MAQTLGDRAQALQAAKLDIYTCWVGRALALTPAALTRLAPLGTLSRTRERGGRRPG
jgi:hypothetical protein